MVREGLYEEGYNEKGTFDSHSVALAVVHQSRQCCGRSPYRDWMAPPQQRRQQWPSEHSPHSKTRTKKILSNSDGKSFSAKSKKKKDGSSLSVENSVLRVSAIKAEIAIINP